MSTLSGTDFELYAYRALRARYPASSGWQIHEQYVLPSGARVDFLITRGRDRVVVDCKDKATLTLGDVDQVDGYAAEARANAATIYIANDTDIPDQVYEETIALGIEIQRTQWGS